MTGARWLVPLLLAVGCAPSLRMHQIAPGVWLHVTLRKSDGYPANGLVVEGAHDSTMVDATWNDSEARQIVRAWQRRRRPIRQAVVTHWHDDRLGGVAALQRAGVRVFALPATIAHARAHGLPVPDAPLPADGVVGDVVAFFPGAGHSDDNIVVWVPSARVLFGGCFVKSSDATGLGNIADADLAAWPAAIARVREKFPDPAIVVPGHGAIEKAGGGDALGHTLELLHQRGATTTAVP